MSKIQQVLSAQLTAAVGRARMLRDMLKETEGVMNSQLEELPPDGINEIEGQRGSGIGARKPEEDSLDALRPHFQ